MNAPAIRAIVAAVLAGIAPEVDLSAVRDDEDLRDALDLDSMDFLNLVIGLGQRTGRKIRDDEAPRLRTLAGITAFFDSNAAKAS